MQQTRSGPPKHDSCDEARNLHDDKSECWYSAKNGWVICWFNTRPYPYNLDFKHVLITVLKACLKNHCKNQLPLHHYKGQTKPTTSSSQQNIKIQKLNVMTNFQRNRVLESMYHQQNLCATLFHLRHSSLFSITLQPFCAVMFVVYELSNNNHGVSTEKEIKYSYGVVVCKSEVGELSPDCYGNCHDGYKKLLLCNHHHNGYFAFIMPMNSPGSILYSFFHCCYHTIFSPSTLFVINSVSFQMFSLNMALLSCFPRTELHFSCPFKRKAAL